MVDDYEEFTGIILEKEMKVIQQPYTPLYMKVLKLYQETDIEKMIGLTSENILWEYIDLHREHSPLLSAVAEYMNIFRSEDLV